MVSTNRGPIPACDPPFTDCAANTLIQNYIYVVNTNRLTNVAGRRDMIPNAYVIDSVDETITVNGEFFGFNTFTPPPNAYTRGRSGRWPSTVSCPASGPCNVVEKPAVIPLEDTAADSSLWIHGSNEPDGQYVFTYTVHGTLNGVPVDLTASSPPVRMTR